jgi:hypothetical protein
MENNDITNEAKLFCIKIGIGIGVLITVIVIIAHLLLVN